MDNWSFGPETILSYSHVCGKQESGKDFPGIFIGYSLNSGRLDRGLDHSRLAPLRTTSRQKFASKDSSLTKLESRNCMKHSSFFAQETRSSRTTSNLTLSESREIRREESTLFCGRGEERTLCSAHGITLCKKMAGLQTLLKGKISGVCLGNVLIAFMSRPEENCVYRKSYLSQVPSNYVDVVRQTKTEVGQFGREQCGLVIGH